MASAVFTTKVDPSYDDLPELRYHFPSRYLQAAQRAVGGLVVYYEPRRSSSDPSSRGGRQAYFAVARLEAITPDPRLADHHYAWVSEYVEFVNPVPFRVAGRTPESRLSKGDGSTNKGRAGLSVRAIPDEELAEIVSLGLAHALEPDRPLLVADEAWPERRMVTTELIRPYRERAFRENVRRAYDNTCAVTGLRLVNGGGAAEIEAAHIHAVADGGPDVSRNGIALSRTVHWMFDRFLFTIEDDLTLRLSPGASPASTGGLLRPGARLIVPDDLSARPHPLHLRQHRERFEAKHGRHLH
jgi:putative restriction endonuclease